MLQQLENAAGPGNCGAAHQISLCRNVFPPFGQPPAFAESKAPRRFACWFQKLPTDDSYCLVVYGAFGTAPHYRQPHGREYLPPHPGCDDIAQNVVVNTWNPQRS